MARIAGVDRPPNKRVEIALTYIYGVGRTISGGILEQAKVDKDKRAGTLTPDEVNRIKGILEKDYKIEGELRRDKGTNIKRLIEIGSYRGMRHRRNLPARGQRTKTNARTKRGPKKTVAGRGRRRGAKKK